MNEESYQDDMWKLFRDTFCEIEFYVNTAKEPAFLITSTNRTQNQLLMNTVGKIGTYTSLKKAKDRLKEIVESANIPVQVFSKTRHRGMKKLFAENKILRIKIPEKEDMPYKVFEIPEWNSIVSK